MKRQLKGYGRREESFLEMTLTYFEKIAVVLGCKEINMEIPLINMVRKLIISNLYPKEVLII